MDQPAAKTEVALHPASALLHYGPGIGRSSGRIQARFQASVGTAGHFRRMHGATRAVLALVGTLAFVNDAGPTVDAQAFDRRVLRIELVVFRGLGERQIAMVVREVDEIWAAQEVTVEWSDHERPSSVR